MDDLNYRKITASHKLIQAAAGYFRARIRNRTVVRSVGTVDQANAQSHHDGPFQRWVQLLRQSPGTSGGRRRCWT